MSRNPFTQAGNERGSVAIVVGIVIVPLIIFVAMAIDVSTQVEDRHRLWDTLDSASMAGARELPDALGAEVAALAYADENFPGSTPTVEFWCLIGKDSGGQPAGSQIPVTCDPGPGPYDAVGYPGMVCNESGCAFPCDPHPPENDVCNTVALTTEEEVEYGFGRVAGVDSGSTGVLDSAACKGLCGVDTAEVPIDMGLVVDRSGSMTSADIDAVKAASRSLLEELRPSLHHVALGTFPRSMAAPPPACPSQKSADEAVGTWVPVGLSSDYDLTDSDPPDNPPSLNDTSSLVLGIDCLDDEGYTNLGDPLFAMGQHLNTVGRADVAKGILFMSDGAANRPSSEADPCAYAHSRAAAVKATGVKIITLAYRLEGVTCSASGQPTTELLADMATDPLDGPATADDGGDGPGGLPGGCNAAPEIASENADGDHFFCAPSAAQLRAVYLLAGEAIIADLGDNLHLVRPPS